MPIDPRVKVLAPSYDRSARESEMLAHARQDADRLGLDDYFVADVDSHREPDLAWSEVLEYIENPVMRENSRHDLAALGVKLYVPYAVPGGSGYSFQAMHGRVPHQEFSFASGIASVARDVGSCRRVIGSPSR